MRRFLHPLLAAVAISCLAAVNLTLDARGPQCTKQCGCALTPGIHSTRNGDCSGVDNCKVNQCDGCVTLEASCPQELYKGESFNDHCNTWLECQQVYEAVGAANCNIGCIPDGGGFQ